MVAKRISVIKKTPSKLIEGILGLRFSEAWGFGANPAMHYSLPIYRFNYGSKALLWRLLIGI